MFRIPAIVIVALACLAPGAAAQTSAPPLTAGWRDGFVLQTDDGDYRLQLNFLLQTDGRFDLDDEGAELRVDTFLIRRARPIFQARIAKYFDFYLAPDFAGGALNLRGAYLETRFSPAFRVRVGKDKVPFGLERLQSASSLMFVERGFPTAVAPDRDIGVQVIGDIADGFVSYAAGLFNGVVDGASSDTDANAGKDFAGRIVVRPYARSPKHPGAGLGVALAVSTGDQPAMLPSFRTSTQQVFYTYDRDALGEASRARISPQVFYYYRGFGGFAEYVRSAGDVTNGSARDDVSHTAWTINGSYVITGEPATDRGVRPSRPFDPARGHWGALQLAVRMHALDVESIALTHGFAGSGALRAKGFTVGANWYLNNFVKWVLNLEHVSFDEPVDVGRPSETALLFRNQINF